MTDPATDRTFFARTGVRRLAGAVEALSRSADPEAAVAALLARRAAAVAQVAAELSRGDDGALPPLAALDAAAEVLEEGVAVAPSSHLAQAPAQGGFVSLFGALGGSQFCNVSLLADRLQAAAGASPPDRPAMVLALRGLCAATGDDLGACWTWDPLREALARALGECGSGGDGELGGGPPRGGVALGDAAGRRRQRDWDTAAAQRDAECVEVHGAAIAAHHALFKVGEPLQAAQLCTALLRDARARAGRVLRVARGEYLCVPQNERAHYAALADMLANIGDTFVGCLNDDVIDDVVSETVLLLRVAFPAHALRCSEAAVGNSDESRPLLPAHLLALAEKDAGRECGRWWRRWFTRLRPAQLMLHATDLGLAADAAALARCGGQLSARPVGGNPNTQNLRADGDSEGLLWPGKHKPRDDPAAARTCQPTEDWSRSRPAAGQWTGDPVTSASPGAVATAAATAALYELAVALVGGLVATGAPGLPRAPAEFETSWGSAHLYACWADADALARARPAFAAVDAVNGLVRRVVDPPPPCAAAAEGAKDAVWVPFDREGALRLLGRALRSNIPAVAAAASTALVDTLRRGDRADAHAVLRPFLADAADVRRARTRFHLEPGKAVRGKMMLYPDEDVPGTVFFPLAAAGAVVEEACTALAAKREAYLPPRFSDEMRALGMGDIGHYDRTGDAALQRDLARWPEPTHAEAVASYVAAVAADEAACAAAAAAVAALPGALAAGGSIPLSSPALRPIVRGAFALLGAARGGERGAAAAADGAALAADLAASDAAGAPRPPVEAAPALWPCQSADAYERSGHLFRVGLAEGRACEADDPFDLLRPWVVDGRRNAMTPLLGTCGAPVAAACASHLAAWLPALHDPSDFHDHGPPRYARALVSRLACTASGADALCRSSTFRSWLDRVDALPATGRLPGMLYNHLAPDGEAVVSHYDKARGVVVPQDASCAFPAQPPVDAAAPPYTLLAQPYFAPAAAPPALCCRLPVDLEELMLFGDVLAGPRLGLFARDGGGGRGGAAAAAAAAAAFGRAVTDRLVAGLKAGEPDTRQLWLQIGLLAATDVGTRARMAAAGLAAADGGPRDDVDGASDADGVVARLLARRVGRVFVEGGEAGRAAVEAAAECRALLLPLVGGEGGGEGGGGDEAADAEAAAVPADSAAGLFSAAVAAFAARAGLAAAPEPLAARLRRAHAGRADSADYCAAFAHAVAGDGDAAFPGALLARLRAAPPALAALAWPGLAAPGAESGVRLSAFFESVLDAELPKATAVFANAGVAPAAVFQGWWRSCWFDALPWPEAARAFACVLAKGADYAAYLGVALLRHLLPVALRLVMEDRPGLVVPALVAPERAVVEAFSVADNAAWLDALAQGHRGRAGAVLGVENVDGFENRAEAEPVGEP